MASADDRSARLDATRQQSRAVWDKMATGWYEQRDWWAAMSSAVNETMIERLDPRPGDTVLELAAGVGDTGFMAASRVGDAGKVISTDFAPQMVDAARERATELGLTNVTFRVLDAERMDLETDSVDGVLCRWGYMLMIDPAAALAETRRVLRPEGRVVFSVFSSPAGNPWVSLLGGILVTRGHMPPPDPTAPGIFAMSDPERIRKLVTSAGFAEPEITEVAFRMAFPHQDAYWSFLTDQAGAISPILQGLSPEDRSAVRQQLHEAARPFHSGDGYDLPALCLNVVSH